MTGFNRVVLVGNLTRDPQLRQIPSGTAVADMGLATNERYRNREGEMAESTCFVDIVAWGKQAESCNQYLAKGSPVLIEGRLQYDQWQTAEGQKRSKLRVRADRIRFMGKAAGAEQGRQSEGIPAPVSPDEASTAAESDDKGPF
jgi:single-strand DNA-binding protein